jgi:hypothetical protein
MLYKLTVTVATAALILPANLGKVVAIADMCILDVPEKKKSRGERSGKQGGHVISMIGPPLTVHFSGK